MSGWKNESVYLKTFQIYLFLTGIFKKNSCSHQYLLILSLHFINARLKKQQTIGFPLFMHVFAYSNCSLGKPKCTSNGDLNVKCIWTKDFTLLCVIPLYLG